jgi:dihydrofolate reductase / thymidylate synthase
MFNIILACDKEYGIGRYNSLPWAFGKDMEYFKGLTTSNNPFKKSIVIMGRNTMESLPKKKLSNRINIIISNKLEDNRVYKDNFVVLNTFQKALDYSYGLNGYDSNDIWVIGGKQLYQESFRHRDLDKVYYTFIEGNFNCDTFISFPWDEYEMNLSNSTQFIVKDNDRKTNKTCHLFFNIIKPRKDAENQYLNLMNEIITNGERRDTRNGETRSLFSKELNFDVSNSVPLLTTKRMFWKGIVEELLFFIRGEINTLKLEEKGIKIWKGNTNKEFLNKQNLNYEEGCMGPMYGYQWRYFNKPLNKESGGIDQLKNLINEIKINPTSRRLLITDFNPSQVNEGVLYPCHSLILQFYVEKDMLSVKMYQRSADVFLGLPFNIASTSLLLYIIAKLTNLNPKMVTISLGDCHIYKEHLVQCKEQLSRTTFQLPKLNIPDFKTLKEVENSIFKDYKLLDYNYHPSIKAQMIA